MGVLLIDHSVSSWKVCADSRNPTVVIRLESVLDNQNGSVTGTQVYKRKTSKQVNRDKQRMTLFRQRLDIKNPHISNVNSDGQDVCTDSGSANINKHEQGECGRRDSWQDTGDSGRACDGVHALVDVEKCTRVRLGDRQDTTSEGTEGQSTTDSNTQGHFATLVPDPCTETCKHTHALT